MDFVMDTDNPNLANLVGTVMDKIIMKYQIFFAKVYRIKKGQELSENHKTSPASQNLLEPLLGLPAH